MIIFMIFTIFTSCQLAARRGGEGRPKGGRANELTTTTAGDRIVWANRTAVCAADAAAAAAAATRELLLVLLLLLMMMRCCPPAMTTTAKTTILRGEHTTRRRQRRRRRRRRRQRRRCRRATCGIHGLHYTRVRFVLCDVDFFTTSIKLNP